MRYWNRNLISATERRPTAVYSSGIFDLRSQSIYKKADAWPPIGELTTSGLALHLDAGDSNSYSGSGSTWSDLTSNNLDFTLINSPTYSSSFGGHFTFDGVDEKAEISSGWTSLSNDPFTIEAWYRNHGSSDFATIIGTQTGGTGTWQMDFGNNRIRWHATFVSGEFITTTANTAALNVWKQVVMVREGNGDNQFKIYLNGAFDSQGTLNALFDFDTNSQLRIACNRAGNNFFDGDLSIIRVYRNKALTATEVAGNYFYNAGRYSL